MEHHNNFIIKYNLATPIAIVIAGALIASAIFFQGKVSFGGSGAIEAPSAQDAAAGGPQAQAVDAAKIKVTNEPYVGQANAKVTMALWTDYQCPFCQRFEADSVESLYKDYVQSGKLKIVFKDFAFLGPDSLSTAVIGRAVWQADPAEYYNWRTTIYRKQGQEGSGWATEDKIYAMTSSILGESTTAKVKALATSNKAAYIKAIDADKTEGGSFGVNGTPGSIIGKSFINGAQPYASVKAAVEKALSGK